MSEFGNIGTLIRKLRGNASLDETAKEIGISKATLSRLERRNIMSGVTLLCIFKWIGVDPIGWVSRDIHDRLSRREATRQDEKIARGLK